MTDYYAKAADLLPCYCPGWRKGTLDHEPACASRHRVKIANALRAAHTAGWNEAVEAAAGVMCDGCREGLRLVDAQDGYDPFHMDDRGIEYDCDAVRILALRRE